MQTFNFPIFIRSSYPIRHKDNRADIIRQVVKLVKTHFRVSTRILRSNVTTRISSDARHICMCVLISLPEKYKFHHEYVATYFNRNRTSVIYAKEKVESIKELKLIADEILNIILQ